MKKATTHALRCALALSFAWHCHAMSTEFGDESIPSTCPTFRAEKRAHTSALSSENSDSENFATPPLQRRANLPINGVIRRKKSSIQVGLLEECAALQLQNQYLKRQNLRLQLALTEQAGLSHTFVPGVTGAAASAVDSDVSVALADRVIFSPLVASPVFLRRENVEPIPATPLARGAPLAPVGPLAPEKAREVRSGVRHRAVSSVISAKSGASIRESAQKQQPKKLRQSTLFPFVRGVAAEPKPKEASSVQVAAEALIRRQEFKVQNFRHASSYTPKDSVEILDLSETKDSSGRLLEQFGDIWIRKINEFKGVKTFILPLSLKGFGGGIFTAKIETVVFSASVRIGPNTFSQCPVRKVILRNCTESKGAVLQRIQEMFRCCPVGRSEVTCMTAQDNTTVTIEVIRD